MNSNRYEPRAYASGLVHQLCTECGVLVGDASAHDNFHDAIEAIKTRANRAGAMTDRIG